MQRALNQHQTHCENLHRNLQRQVQALKNSVELELRKRENEREAALLRANVTKLEQRLTALLKTAAQQTDRSLALKKEVGDIETANKSSVTDLDLKLREVIQEISETKRKHTDLEKKFESSTCGRDRNCFNPDVIAQMIDTLDTQLGLYDVKIADVDLRIQVHESTNYSGVMVWKIKNYSRRKREAVSGQTLSLYSQPFYTSRYGYKMCARIYLNGDGMGKGTHMSLFFVIMKGEYDALLPWPFRQKVTLVLLDQGIDQRHLSDTFKSDPTSSSFKKPTSDMNIASGCPLFVAHNVIEGSSYVKEDTIFLRIHVDTTDIWNVF